MENNQVNMKNGIIFFAIFTCFFSCKHNNKLTDDSIIYIKKDSIMGERYDYESTSGGKQDAYIQKNGWTITRMYIHLILFLKAYIIGIGK